MKLRTWMSGVFKSVIFWRQNFFTPPPPPGGRNTTPRGHTPVSADPSDTKARGLSGEQGMPLMVLLLLGLSTGKMPLI